MSLGSFEILVYKHDSQRPILGPCVYILERNQEENLLEVSRWSARVSARSRSGEANGQTNALIEFSYA